MEHCRRTADRFRVSADELWKLEQHVVRQDHPASAAVAYVANFEKAIVSAFNTAR